MGSCVLDSDKNCFLIQLIIKEILWLCQAAIQSRRWEACRVESVEGVLKKIERPTSNVQHRILNGKNEEKAIGVKCSVLDITFSFDVERSMFDVRPARNVLKPVCGKFYHLI
jgi:hypothetical protein